MMTLNELLKAAYTRPSDEEPKSKEPVEMNRKQKRTQAALAQRARRGQRVRRVKGLARSL